jgi:arylsulfatase A-like enzyme
MPQERPNVIFILADDMGYGDMGCNNPESKIPTPNLDRLAAEGMRFTDAHAGSSVCTPSRYNVLTGRYAWRSRLKHGIVWEWDGPLIEPDRPTVANVLKDAGYRTACIGKWHLGWDWPTRDGSHPNDTLEFGALLIKERAEFGRTNIDWTGRIGGGPVDRGFDSYFGVDVPNLAPYTWFEDDRLTDIPTVEKPDPQMYGHPGLMIEGWSLEAMIPEFTRRAVDLIREEAGSDEPFFLYFPLTSPHSPVVPNEQFKGMSGAGNYGDFVCEVDWVVGQVMDALEQSGQRENTLLIFTSDNGPEKETPDDEGVYIRAEKTRHFSMGPLRGMKRDAWEGGHRVPFVASWPAVTPGGAQCDQLVVLGDLMATCAEIVGAGLPEGAGEDSVSFLPLLRGKLDTPTRTHAIHHSMSGKFAIRRGDWVFIDALTGGDNGEPQWLREERGYTPHHQEGELFRLSGDLIERDNRYAEEPELVKELAAILAEVKVTGGSRESAAADAELTE